MSYLLWIKSLVLIVIVALHFSFDISYGSESDSDFKFVSVGSDVTEILCELGYAKNIVGVDLTSQHPSQMKFLPQVGYLRSLSGEGILSLHPTHIFLSDHSGPPSTLKQIEESRIPLYKVSSGYTSNAVFKKIDVVAEHLGQQEKGEKLKNKILKQLKESELFIQGQKQYKASPKVLFIYARGGGVLNVAGLNTSADRIIQLAGGLNAVQSYEGYKPLTSEALVSINPDILLFTSRGLESLGGMDKLKDIPGMEGTKAFQEKRIVTMDDLKLLGFGPRIGEAALELSEQFYAIQKISQK